MKYKLVIFDFDGTLADTFTWFLGIADEFADHFHLKRIDRSQIETLRGMEMRKIIQSHEVPLWMVPELGLYLQSMLSRDIHRISLYEGIEQVLNSLAGQGTRLAVVSSNTYKNVCGVLGPENAGRIQYYECGISLYGKTTRLKKVLQQSGIAAGEAISIGDEIRDLQAAHRAHIPFGAVSWGYSTLQSLLRYNPELAFNNVAEMAAQII